MPVFGTSANLIVSFGCAQIASARSLPTLSVVDVERGRELDVARRGSRRGSRASGRGRTGRPARPCSTATPWSERVGAVADADDRDADLVLAARLAVARAVRGSHGVLSIADRLLAKGISSASESVTSTRSLTLSLRRRAAALSSRLSSGGMRSTTAPAAPGIALRRGRWGRTGRRSARRGARRRRRSGSTRGARPRGRGARLSGPGMRTSTLVRSRLSASSQSASNSTMLCQRKSLSCARGAARGLLVTARALAESGGTSHV